MTKTKQKINIKTFLFCTTFDLQYNILTLTNIKNFVSADGVTYSFGVFYNEYLNYFEEGKAATSWINSILVGVTLCSGNVSKMLPKRDERMYA